MTEENVRFVATANGLYEYGVWDLDRAQFAITGYENADDGKAAASEAAARMNEREAIRDAVSRLAVERE